MKRSITLLPIFVLFHLISCAQAMPEMKLVTGGNTVIGGGYQYEIQGYSMIYIGQDQSFEQINRKGIAIGEVPMPNNPQKKVSVSDFQLGESEVTNAQYREFVLAMVLKADERKTFDRELKIASKKNESVRQLWQPIFESAATKGILPDSACWTTDFVFSYNKPLTANYFWHPAFDDYPVVGATWKQAKAYCDWLSKVSKSKRAQKGLPALPNYRLPTEAEWEFAALSGGHTQEEVYRRQVFPWNGNNVFDDKGRYLANIKPSPRNYIDDGYEYTAPVKSFPANEMGLYDMAGNVSEWCEDVFIVYSAPIDMNPSRENRDQIQLFYDDDDANKVWDMKRVAKGGSWAEFQYGAQCGSRMGWEEAKGSSRIGFRVARTIAAKQD